MDFSSGMLALFSSNSATGSTSNLLSALYGGGTGTAASASNPIQNLNNAEANQTKLVAATAKEPQVARDVAAFRAAVASAKTVAQLLDNPTALKVLLTANGLGAYTGYAALAKKALTSNPNSKTSVANTLSDQQWKATAKTYDFYDKGLSIIQTPSAIDAIANGYAEVAWRTALDKTTPGLSNALTFRAEASTITSAIQVLGNATMWAVVTTAAGIPQQIAYQTLEAQQKAINNHVDIKKFQDPKFVESFVQKYLIAAAAKASGTSSASGITSLAVQARGIVV